MTMLMGLFAGLGFFLYGMNLMSEGLEKVAGSRMKGILNWCTKNRVIGILVGALFTAVIQSSGATTVMVVSFVNSGLLTIGQAVGPILGANIGTAITGQMVSLDLDAIAPVFILVGVILLCFTKKPMSKEVGRIILGFGILFFGMGTMKEAMGVLADSEGVRSFISEISSPWIGLIIGFGLTLILQSSSASTGILIGMAGSGLFTNFYVAIFYILGSNVAACCPAVLASLNGRKEAKRTAWFDVCFNAFTMLLLTILFIIPFREGYVGDLYANFFSNEAHPARQIANMQTFLKVIQVVIAAPLSSYIIKFVQMVIPGEDAQADTMELKYISVGSAITPTTCILEATREIQRMGVHAIENVERAFDAVINKDSKKIEKVFEVEKQINFLNQEITQYLVQIAQSDMPISDAKYLGAYFHVVSDIERIGDHAENLAEFAQSSITDGFSFSESGTKELKQMYATVDPLLKKALQAFCDRDRTNLKEISELENQTDNYEKQMQQHHVQRMTEGICSPKSAVFSDILTNMERMGDHASNIAFAIFKDEDLENEL